MPDFNLPDVGDAMVRAADLQGKVIMVRFWATWWPICDGEMPSVQRVHDAFKDTDVVVLAISVDGGGIQTVKSYVMKHGYTIPALVDAGMEVARKFGVRAVPMTYVVNRQGVVVASGFGPVDFDRPEFREYLQTLVAQPGG
jgi:peroxiredoxin